MNLNKLESILKVVTWIVSISYLFILATCFVLVYANKSYYEYLYYRSLMNPIEMQIEEGP